VIDNVFTAAACIVIARAVNIRSSHGCNNNWVSWERTPADGFRVDVGTYVYHGAWRVTATTSHMSRAYAWAQRLGRRGEAVGSTRWLGRMDAWPNGA